MLSERRLKSGIANSVLGDMRDLSRFSPETFPLVFNPCSISFIPEVQAVWKVGPDIPHRLAHSAAVGTLVGKPRYRLDWVLPHRDR